MSPCVESPAHSARPVGGSNGNCGQGNLIGDIHTRSVGRRRILVQTDTGNVLGMEFDRADNVQAVKRRLQALLHLPMEQVALACGDTILKSDLSELKKDTPLLLTRSLQRSLSTPCLSPTSEFHMEMIPHQAIEVVGGLMCCPKMRFIIKEIVKAINCGVEPVPISAGLGGAYYFRNSKGESVAIIKPTDEEPLAPNNPKGFVGRMLGEYGLKKGIRVGETGVREVAAYLLDHDSFAKVPPTVLVQITHHIFHTNNAHSSYGTSGKLRSPVTKLASCQAFVFHDSDASDRGSSGFSVAAVHRIGILDIRIFNTDRHTGNILVKRSDMPGTLGSSRMYVNNSLELIPIDHGLCLPESLEDPYFEWLHWPQASVPFSEEELDYIQRLDPSKDVDMLLAELPMLRVASLRTLILSTTFLKKAAAAGFCLAEIGELMSRDGLEEASQLELFCLEAKQEVESKLVDAMADDDDYFPEYTLAGDELEEQFEFEEDNQLSEDAGLQKLSHSQNMYMHTHFAETPELFITGLHVPEVTFNEVPRPSVFHHCQSAGDKTFTCGTLSGPRDVHADQSCLEYFGDDSPLEEEVFTFNLPAKQRTNCANGVRVVSRAISVLNSVDGSSSKSRQSHCSPRSISQIASSIDEVSQRMASWQISKPPSRAMSYKSASLSDRKQRSNFLERRTFGLPGVSVSETLGKAKVAGSTTTVSFGDMSGQEWTCFMTCFEQILQEAFATRGNELIGHRQRLGISLPVLRQVHFS